MEQFVAEVTTAIESERRRGATPEGMPARDLATSLNWTVERAPHASLSSSAAALPTLLALARPRHILFGSVEGAIAVRLGHEHRTRQGNLARTSAKNVPVPHLPRHEGA